MPNVQRLLEGRVTAAMRAAFPDAADAPAILVAAQDPRFGDYQANGAMGLAKRLKQKPRDVAAAIVARLADLIKDVCDPPEIAGPGFINLRLKPDWVAAQVGIAHADDRLGVADIKDEQDAGGKPKAETVIVDYSAPNLAKEMHVGHLRSTIIGDALVRLLSFRGHTVIRQNHVGDWGTQFGTVVLAMWYICMSRYRDDLDYVERTLAALADIELDDPRSREAALLPIRERQVADLWDDFDGTVIFEPFIEQVTQHRSLSLAEMLPAYQLVNRIEALAEGTGLTIPISPHKTEIPYSALSSWIAQMVQRPDLPENLPERKAWQYARSMTIDACQGLYDRMRIQLTPTDIRGESAYNALLPRVIKHLDDKHMLSESEGAQCVFLKSAIDNPQSEMDAPQAVDAPDSGKPLFVNKEGEPLPLIVQKSDEGYLYATTDLAAIAFRTGVVAEFSRLQDGSESPRADRVLYVVDARQALHFAMVFECAFQAGLAERGRHHLEHVGFGTMMGSDGRPFKTRSGDTVKLMDLLDQAEQQALELVSSKNDEDVAAGRAAALDENERKEIAHIVGIGAVKYADLSQSRTSDYVFSWDKMLSLQGNTAPYMQYAYARVRSIFRKGSHEAGDFRGDAAPIALESDAELALGKALLRFPETVDRALDDYRPNVLAAYLYDLAGAFTAFYDACPVLQSAEPLRSRRLKLCDLTARVIRTGLGLLGIETAERM
jgi:arginyl-tRNA synthetase